MALSTNEVQDANRSEVPTQTVTNTGLGNLIAKCAATKQPLNIQQFSTLNEVYGILGDESLGVKNGQDFTLKYFGIGVKGSKSIGEDSNGVTRLKVNQHQPIDGNLFFPIPFIARPLDNDLDNITRAKYRMRVVRNVGSTPWVFYYLKLISFTNYNPVRNEITRDASGNESSRPYIPVRDDLENPQPVDFTSEGTVPTTNTYHNSSAILDCSLDQNDLQEIANACQVLYNDPTYGSINEVSIVYGIDTQNTGQIAGGAAIQYTEVLSACVAHFFTERDGRNAFNNTQINLAFDHGASEPMLVYTSTTTAPVSP